MTIELFNYESTPVRTATLDGNPALVVADIAKILGYRDASNAARLLRPHQQGYSEVSTPSGTQRMLVCNEGGVNRLIMRSNAPSAELVQDWFTDEVLPALRKTGTYSTAPALTDDELIHKALSISTGRVAALTERVAELEPKALVAEKLLDATGDYEVADAAKVLSRSGVTTGRGRLFADLEARGWIYRHRGDGKWRVNQKNALEPGYMAELPQSHYHPKTGILVLDPPQPRVTPKGIARILKDYNHTGELVKA
ncbi:phage antirepressor KilAC domain-containing protein [Rhodococcus erythropolis]|uniref:phage antirepressor KilAC domain-containing protein n=1 Tax=Rhodococcus erythropolis TaxID=1833 RepID=UPI002949F7F6|nr:phage antirepressor KilAC domain-containing protein [Rhodococcus erythropolis]MDV6275875.1 phage antirepressor KilAC domain-containing protein [Rhodococcus erythropolis]